ncbi:MAG TPA: lytic transglycosylase domain-containing protein [Nocardioides sp.]|jgi:membrane-bound lytic murein transglycosylase B|uniref:lytic transglycosylase domain-containing protein n=1 Tax=Nocardioides sp. TaxID=35761 RepID=UPI002E3502DF|nr:lytic transglycosylase domain-containing protein [Nocardioides sp.]HEX3929450.1 lytic transglycosylase domain-containing protein [Nocardioides sp.]
MTRFGRAQKASALLPLAVLSAAWTAGLATAGSDPSAAASSQTLPDGTRLPGQAVRAPASLTPSHALSRRLQRNAHRVVATSAASGIPTAALAAYQRAATVIDAADPTCHLPWQLVAAIGRVESDHGRAQGNVLNDRGIDKPGIYGPVLDGRHGTVLIKDTDAGQYDHDTAYDRAVGPMQFIPSTWAIVGVDADNDGQRDPQDINDASLASAVYLCSGTDDLSTTAGQQAAVYRYNHSKQYVSLVLAIERAYQAGDFSEVPNGLTSTGFSLADPTSGSPGRSHRRHHHHHHRHHSPGGPGGGPTTAPTTGPSTGPSSGPSNGPTTDPTHSPSPILPSITLPTILPTTILPTALPTLLTEAQAIIQCLAKGLLEGTPAFNACVTKLTHG